MALFGDPQKALEAAIAMQDSLPSLNLRNVAQGFEPIELGIGLQHGTVRMGIIGEAGRVQNTVIGDVVNTASRLEALNKDLGTKVLVTRSVLEHIHPLPKGTFRLVDICKLRGKTRSVHVYEAFSADPPAIREKKRALAKEYSAALRAYSAGDPLHLLDRCLQHSRSQTKGSLFANYGKMKGIFAGVDVDRLKGHQTRVVAHPMGAPLSFDPTHLKAVHTRLDVAGHHFDSTLGHLMRSLLHAGVESADAMGIVAKFDEFRGEIVSR